MFVQVIQGRVTDPAGMRAHTEKWAAEIGVDADGWLDSTAGVTDDGTSIAFVRFESEEAARRNSERPAQGEWWEKMATFFTEEPTFQDCTLVDADEYGDLGSAGFVQVMRGEVSDVAKAREVMANDTLDWQALRPDIVARVWAGSEDGSWTMAIYFTTEAAAREGEQKQMPPEAEAMMAELNALAEGEPTFLDLRDPWLMSRAQLSA
jgi:hypothetical protein